MKPTKEAIRQMAIRGEDITQLDVSHLTDLSFLFHDERGWKKGKYISPLQDFNQDISG